MRLRQSCGSLLLVVFLLSPLTAPNFVGFFAMPFSAAEKLAQQVGFDELIRSAGVSAPRVIKSRISPFRQHAPIYEAYLTGRRGVTRLLAGSFADAENGCRNGIGGPLLC